MQPKKGRNYSFTHIIHADTIAEASAEKFVDEANWFFSAAEKSASSQVSQSGP
jgi:hypothetical protein